MKTTVLLTGILLFALGASAASFRVNNQGFGAPFLQINPAIAAASAGDTIYVEPSPTTYASLTVSKAVVIIGVGYFLAENNIPGVTPLSASTSSVTITAANAKLLSLVVSSVTIQAANATIQRCRTGQISLNGGAQNFTIIQSYITSTINANSGSGHLVSNCYIVFGFGGSAPMVVTQNTINGNGNSFSYAPANSTVSNNIYYNFNASNPVLPTNTVFFNNVGTVTNLPNLNGNVNGAVQGSLFIGPNAITASPVDAALQLAVGSPAIGAGVSGENVGMFGGNAPYRLSGLPPIPRITAVLAPNVVGVNQPFNVTINAQSVE